MNQEKVFKQDTQERMNTAGIAMFFLYFKEEPEFPTTALLQEKLQQFYGDHDIVSDTDDIKMFSIKDYPVEYADGQKVPAQLLMTTTTTRNQDLITDFIQSQFWNFPNFEEVLDECFWQVMISDFVAAGLPVHKRAELLAKWLDVALALFPTCVAVYYSPSENLLPADIARNNPYEGALRYLHGGINARFFRIQGSEDMLVDTLGLHILDLPDVQYHFHDLDPNTIVNHAYNLAFYQFEQLAPIESGHTVQGLSEEEQWVCQYENALIQPTRIVLDINTGKYAAGNRNDK